jgi:hypothetical protein
VEKRVAVLVRQEGLGHVEAQDREFALEMFERFLHSLESRPVKPEAICFYTDGVKLTCEGSPVVTGLQLIEGMGVKMLICKTCLDYYRLSGKVAVGQVSSMNEIVKILMEADTVITV